jgi:hypothetical protein
MPKVNLTTRKVLPTGTSSVMTRRKRFQMVKARQQLEDETSSSSFNEFRLVCDLFNNQNIRAFFRTKMVQR